MVKGLIFTIPLYCIIVGSVYASEEKEYTDELGNQFNQEEYDERLMYCYEMKSKGILPSENSIVNCENWVLTDDGTNIIAKYVIQKFTH